MMSGGRSVTSASFRRDEQAFSVSASSRVFLAPTTMVPNVRFTVMQ